MNSSKNIKVVLVGLAGSGKTSLITSFLYGHTIVPEKPILYGTFSKELYIE